MSEVGGAVVSRWRKASSPGETNLAIQLILGSGFTRAEGQFAARFLSSPSLSTSSWCNFLEMKSKLKMQLWV